MTIVEKNEIKRIRSYFPHSALNHNAAAYDKSIKRSKKSTTVKEAKVNPWMDSMKDFCEF